MTDAADVQLGNGLCGSPLWGLTDGEDVVSRITPDSLCLIPVGQLLSAGLGTQAGERSHGDSSEIHRDPPKFTKIHRDPPRSTRIYQDPSGSTEIHQNSPRSTKTSAEFPQTQKVLEASDLNPGATGESSMVPHQHRCLLTLKHLSGPSTSCESNLVISQTPDLDHVPGLVKTNNKLGAGIWTWMVVLLHQRTIVMDCPSS